MGDAFEKRLEGYGQKREEPSDILWNFEKFLIAKDGSVLMWIAPDVTPEDDRVIERIELELAA